MLFSEHTLRSWVRQQDAADSAHDIAHIERVVSNAKRYAKAEGANMDVVVAAAWLHDCVTVPKSSPLREKASALAAEKASELLLDWGCTAFFIDKVAHAIEAHSYSAQIEAKSLEAKIIQDADRIDAIGAIGVARCCMVGGALGRELYSVADPFCDIREPDDSMFCLDHFYTKLFNIANSLHTPTAQYDAKKRLSFMRAFLNQLAAEI